ncbi:MAG: hypothetical protein ACI8T1_005270 [Verrucomicrobiales bacterium]|jgi:hypothetical protein
MTEQTVTIPLEQSPKVGYGLVHVTIDATESDGDLDPYFHLPPRYRGHDAKVTQHLGLEVVDVGILRGFNYASQWVKSALRFRRKATV